MAQSAQALIRNFFKSEHFAVVGASTDRQKFGNKVLRALQNKFGRDKVTPVNPNGGEIEGVAAKTLADVLASKPKDNLSISIVTPPAISLQAVQDCYNAGVTRVWLQPGAENANVLKFAAEHNMHILAGGPCVLVQLGVPDHE